MTVERIDPPFETDGELSMLVAWLEYQRATLAMKCDGVPPERLRERTVEPSSMSLLGLVRHMAEVERNWFRRVLDADYVPGHFNSREDPDADFDGVDTADVEEAFGAWRSECEHARDVLATFASCDDLGRGKWRTGQAVSVRWVLVHMIEEYARHNGHADLIRERLDGSVGD